MRKKSKQDSSTPEAVEMIIKINNENVVIEVLPPFPEKGKELPSVAAEVGKISSENEILMDSNSSTHGMCEDSNMSCSSDDKSQPGPSPSSTEERKTTHNQSEKLRRAQLKASMEKLKLLVPLEDSSQKYTTASLLRKARYLIQKLEDRERRNIVFKEQLHREQRYLRKRLEQIQQLPRDGTQDSSCLVSSPANTSIQLQNKSRPSCPSTKSKYPLPLSTSQGQLKTPPILKRKYLEPESTEIIYLSSHPAEVKAPQLDLAVSPATTTSSYEMITTTDGYSLTSNSIAENYCIIIDAGMVHDGFHPIGNITIE